MLPGWGYWILANSDDMLVIGGSLMQPASLPPSRTIVPGWNLIGYYGTEGLMGYYGPVGAGDLAICALATLSEDIWDFPTTSLWTYWEPYNPDAWIPLGELDNMDPGAGYWLLSPDEGLYSVSTVCPFPLP